MDTTTLRAVLKARGIRPSELARRVGVSRQAVSLWLNREHAVRGEYPAVARLVEVHGLFATAGMLGKRVWDEFPAFERHTHASDDARGASALFTSPSP